ncbi:MAG TPA: CoB--CoM heterodisulfide reductase iron-sulfur subunit B family protein [Sulfurovum sp.]|jgi:succinate dehydrogenase / fumarate reductase cytochrome b subunit|nr:MAG: heterodisulfide reductase subunit B [Sulfurovum sp. 35-42-20]OYY56021.1 MAG: heterodisulfide reductase subunit B [Sulfurovum sp. 28-43-6]OYZ24022.1 MAG: heterodisulfide reductase subunit B [Sulfurovum sp. 16-42-52]OYZ48301.1 MAG: heterodisulfide reductase subunit B [Sulfurovum sp. 24-42-9]OZA43929.1 MAG: heterodisulfide reductase subunit B [Sulfurovum sp. 17-42-90]OZA60741.1 MAG: heterodisulfide reductase subunit B [Sulfurovum sp. 39-42-12]HQR74593.1 CoB--CoM heterodisulfide reductase
MSQLHYALFTGCTAKQSTPELLSSTLAVAEKLGIKITILEEASCCGASHLQDFDEFLAHVLNARNICYAEKLNLTMITICNTCQLNSAMTKHALDKDPVLKAKVNEKLAEVGLEYKGTSQIKHFLYAIIDEYGLENVKDKVTVPLSHLNIAPFYGCHNIRPSELHEDANGHENPYNPNSLDRLITALEGHPVNYESKNKCCGFHVELQANHTSEVLAGNALLDAMDNNADMMVTPCPLCHLKMDTYQDSISKTMGRDVELPVLHMPQMVALALGCSEQEIGLKFHVQKAKHLYTA